MPVGGLAKSLPWDPHSNTFKSRCPTHRKSQLRVYRDTGEVTWHLSPEQAGVGRTAVQQ